jgi:hypothetical protein
MLDICSAYVSFVYELSLRLDACLYRGNFKTWSLPSSACCCLNECIIHCFWRYVDSSGSQCYDNIVFLWLQKCKRNSVFVRLFAQNFEQIFVDLFTPTISGSWSQWGSCGRLVTGIQNEGDSFIQVFWPHWSSIYQHVKWSTSTWLCAWSFFFAKL